MQWQNTKSGKRNMEEISKSGHLMIAISHFWSKLVETAKEEWNMWVTALLQGL